MIRPDGRELYVACEASYTVIVVDGGETSRITAPRSLSMAATVDFPAPDRPVNHTVAPSSRVARHRSSRDTGWCHHHAFPGDRL